MGHGQFETYIDGMIKNGHRWLDKFLQKGKSALELLLETAEKEGVDSKLIAQAREKGMITGDLLLQYEGAQKIYKKIKEMVKKQGEKINKDLGEILGSFDPIIDHDLIATAIMAFCPEVRKKVGNKIEHLYRVVLNVGTEKRRGYALPVKERKNIIKNKSLISEDLEELISVIPKALDDEDEKYQKLLKVIIRKKVEREVFPVFKDNKEKAFILLDKKIKNEKNALLKKEYQILKRTYKNYINLHIPGVNPHFEDPETKEKGVLPSLHQKIALYYIKKEKRYGIFDDCGTGKTAIAAIAKNPIEKELKKKGKIFRKAIVVCPNSGKKAWKNGLIGPQEERYLSDKNMEDKVHICYDEIKSKDFLKKLKKKEWVVLNYDQLNILIKDGKKGKKQPFYKHLKKMGYDYVILDESHKIKGYDNETPLGKATHSFAARYLALNAEYVCLLTGDPIADKLKDFGVLYHLLNPRECPTPEDFKALYEENPRILYTLFNEKSIRRLSEDINEHLKWKEEEIKVKLGKKQRILYDHIVLFRPSISETNRKKKLNWASEARKALIDPRLVDPEILQKVGLLGKITYKDSAKYQELVSILTGENSPIRKGEKFILFSSMFKHGITRPGSKKLEQRYNDMGLEKEYKSLGLDKSLSSLLEKRLQKEFGNEFSLGIIDGNIVKIEDREDIVEDLKTKYGGISCTTDTGGESLDFSETNHAYFLDEDYCPKTTHQALCRLKRKGQKKKAFINYLRCDDTLEGYLVDYLDKKRILIQIATDGHPLTPEEEALLEDTDGKHFVDLVKRGLGGKSINVLEAASADYDDFTIKKRVQRKKRLSPNKKRSLPKVEISYNPTIAQKVNSKIGQDPECWKKTDFCSLYMKALQNLAVPVIHRAKIMNLIEHASRDVITFPRKVISEGAGPSLLYNAYRGLKDVVKNAGFKIPQIIDRDTSLKMLDQGNNPNKIQACMTGFESPFKAKTFDMVDNESISLLKNPTEVYECLQESHRILKNNGIMELIVKNMRYMDSFYSGLEQLGFELISKKNEGFAISKSYRNKLRRENGDHFAEAYASKLRDTYLILARKVDKPSTVDSESFWFETIGYAPEVYKEGKKLFEVENTIENNSRQALPGEIPGMSEDMYQFARMELR